MNIERRREPLFYFYRIHRNVFLYLPRFFIVTPTVSHLPAVDVLSYISLFCTWEMTFSREKTASCGIITDDDVHPPRRHGIADGSDDGKQQEREFGALLWKLRISRANWEKIYCTNEHIHAEPFILCKRHPKSATNFFRPLLLSSKTMRNSNEETIRNSDAPRSRSQTAHGSSRWQALEKNAPDLGNIVSLH